MICIFELAKFGGLACLWRAILIGLKAVLVHDPIGFLAIGSSALVIHQGLPHANQALLGIDGLVPTCCLPESSCGRTVRSSPRWVFLVLVAEEVPIALLLLRPYPTFLYMYRNECARSERYYIILYCRC
jgi:hypothetical protein